MKYKQVKFRLSSWNKLRRAFYGWKDETFSDYIERIAGYLRKKILKGGMKNGNNKDK